MSSILTQLPKTTTRSAKRLGRGIGSGKGGHNSSRGTKGAGARKSSNLPLWFEGGQLPLVKRLPMIRGKSRLQSLGRVAEINLGDLVKVKGSPITLAVLKEEKLIGVGVRAVKIVNTGKIDQALTIEGLRISTGAKQALEAAGGQVK